MTFTALRFVEMMADSRPRPELAPVMMMVLPAKVAVGGGTLFHFSRRKWRGLGFMVEGE